MSTMQVKVDGVDYATFAEALNNVQDGSVVELLADVVNETVQDYNLTVKLTINGNGFKMENVHLNPLADLVLDKIAFAGDSTVNASNANCKSLTITNCTADVTPAKEGFHPTFVNLGTSEYNVGLSLTMTGNTILVDNDADGYGKAVFGWRHLDNVTISNNTFGSEAEPLEKIAVKLMNFNEGAEVVIENNTIYGSDAEREFLAIDLYQNNSRANNYTAEIGGNTVVNVNKKAGNGFSFALVECNNFNAGMYGNGSVQIMADNTMNGKAVTMDDVKRDSSSPDGDYDYIGVNVTKDENGKITGGTFRVGEQGKSEFEDALASGVIAGEANADGLYELVQVDLSTIYVDSSLAGKNYGDEIAEGKIFGINAFANFTSAFNYAADNEAVSKIEIGSDITETDYVELNKIRHDLSIVAAPGKNVNVKIPGALSDKGKGDDICVENKATLTLGEGVSIDQIDQFVPGYTGVGSLVVNGDITINRIQSWGNSTVTINKTGSVKLSGDDGYLYFVGEHAELNVYGNLTGTDDESLKNAKESLHIGYANMVDYWSCNNEIVFNFEDALVACTSGFASTAYSFKVNLDNSVFDMSCFTVNKGTTTFSLSNDAKVIASSLTVNADCSVNIVGDGGTVDVNGTLTNNGTITVDGYSTVVLKNYSGDGRLVVDLTGYTGRGGNIIVDAAAGMQWDGKYEVKAEENSKYSVEVDKENGDLVLKKDESVIQLETVTTGEGDGQVSSNKLVFSDDGSVVQDASEKVGAENVDMVIDAADGEVTDTADIRADIVGKDVTITNNKDLLIEEGKKITATGNVNIENGSVVAKDGDPEAKLTGSVAAETIVMTNNGHADVDFTAKNMVIANNSVNTLTGTLGDGTTESIVIGAGTIKDGEVLADKKSEGSIEDATISAKSIELSNQQVSDTTFAGFVLANGDVSFDGVNTFEKHELTKSKYHSVVKVTNGAVVTIGKDAVINGCNYFYIAAGNDSGYFGFADNSTGSGTIDIYGKVSATQINADASGTVNVKAGAEVDTEIICVEKGGISGATAGKMNIDGNVSAQNFNLFNGGKAVVNTGAVLEATRLNNERRYISVAYGSELDVNGGSVVIDTANASTGQSNSASAYLQLDGKMNVYNNGSVTVKKITTDEEGWKEAAKNSYFAIGKDGLLTVTGGTVDVGTLKNAGTITVTAKSVGDTAAITAGSIIGTGVITVDAKGFTGVKKVVDITGVGQEWADGQLVFKNLGKTKVVYGNDDGDVTLVNVDTSKLYVNSAWADYENNQAIAGSDDKLAFGINAFADFRKALAVANENKGGNIVLADEEYSWKTLEKGDEQRAVITNAGTYDITGGEGVLLNYEFEINPEKAAGNFVVKIHDAYFTCGKFTMRNNAIVTIDNSQIDSVYNKANNELYNDGTNYFSVYTNSVVTVNNSKICYTPEASKFGAVYQVYGTATFNDSDIYAYVSPAPEAGFGVYGNGTVTLNASDLYCSFINVGVGITEKYLADGVDKTDLTATMTFNGSTVKNSAYQGDHNGNNSKIIVGSADGSTAGKLVITAGTDVDFRQKSEKSEVISTLEVRNADSSVEISGDSTLDIDKVSNAGTIKVSGSTLIADTVTNNGTFSVGGESTLDIDNYNNGKFVWGKAIQLLNGAIIKDSNVGGYVDAVGKVTFRGDNTFGTIQDFEANYIDNNKAVNKTEMIIEKGASVTTTSQKFTIGFGDKLSVYGNLEDAKAAYEAGTLTADDYSLDAQKGMFFQGNRANDVTTFNVKDAYVRLGANGQNVANAKDENQRFGTYNFNWTNAVVESEETFDFKDSGENNGKYNFNLDNTVLKVGAVETDKSYADAENNPAYRGAINFADKDSTFKAEDSKVVVIGKESNNYNAGTFEFDNSELNLNAALVNDGSATFDGENAELNATNVINRGTITLANGAELNAGSYSTVSAKVAFYDGSDEPENITFVAYDKAGKEIGRTTAFINGAAEVAVVKGDSYKAFKADGTQINDATFEIVADSSDANLVLDEAASVKVDTFYNGGTISVTNSTLVASTLTNGGTISVTNSTLVASTLTNNGTFTATDASITASAFKNTGIFTLNGGTVNGGNYSAGTITNKGTFTVNGGTVNASALTNWGALFNSGAFTIAANGAYNQTGGDFRMVSGATFTVAANGAYNQTGGKFWLQGGDMVVQGYAEIKQLLENASKYTYGSITVDGTYAAKGNNGKFIIDKLTIQPNGSLNVVKGGYFKSEGAFSTMQGASLTVDNSTFIANSVSNSGSFIVKGASTLEIGSLSGSAAIKVADGAKLSGNLGSKEEGTDKIYGVNLDLEGTAALTDKANFVGEIQGNNLSIGKNYSGSLQVKTVGDAALVIAAGAVLDSNDKISGNVKLLGNITVNNADFEAAVTGNKNITVSHSGSFALSGGEVNTITVTKSESDAYKKFVLSGDTKVNTIVFSSNANIFCGLVGPSQVEVGNIVIDGKVGLSGWLNTSNTANITGKNKAELTLNSASFFTGNKITGVKLNLTNVGVDKDVDVAADVALSDVKSINDNAVSSVDGVYFYTADEKTYILNKVDGGIDIVEATENKDLFEDEMGNFTLEGDLSDFDVTMKSGKTTLKVANGDSAAIGSIDKNDQGGVNNVSVGNGSGLTVGNIERMGNITVGKNGSVMTVTEKLTGTSAAETISIGNGSTFIFGDTSTIRDLDFASGKATFKLGKDAEAEIYGNYIVYGSSNSITLGADADMVITGNIINYCGNNYDPVSGTVKYAPISGTTIKLGKGAEMTGNDIIGLAGLTLANGSAEKRNKKGVVTAKEVNTIFTAHNVYGTEKNNTINVGNYGKFTAADIDLFSGNDTFKIGNDSIVNLGALDFGAGNDTFKIGNNSIVNLGVLDFGAGKNTLTIGKNSELTLDSVSGLGTFNATKGASVWFNDMEDVKLEGIKGSWKNATIYDMQGSLEDTKTSDTEWIAEIFGWTYGNERDFYTFTGAANDKISVIGADSNNIVMLYKNENDSWNEVGMLSPLNTSTQLQENGQYAVAVYVVGADMNKNNNSLNDDNAYAFKIQLA